MDPQEKYLVGFRWLKVHQNLQIYKATVAELENRVHYIGDHHILHWVDTIAYLKEEWLNVLSKSDDFEKTMYFIEKLDEDLCFYISILEEGHHIPFLQTLDLKKKLE